MPSKAAGEGLHRFVVAEHHIDAVAVDAESPRKVDRSAAKAAKVVFPSRNVAFPQDRSMEGVAGNEPTNRGAGWRCRRTAVLGMGSARLGRKGLPIRPRGPPRKGHMAVNPSVADILGNPRSAV